jgi:hypothetical protein
VVREDLTGIFIRRADGSRILHGTDAEALEFSRRVKQHFSQMALRMLQAPSIARLTLQCQTTDAPVKVQCGPHLLCGSIQIYGTEVYRLFPIRRRIAQGLVRILLHTLCKSAESICLC